MPAFFNDRVLDNGLTVLDTEATHLHICSNQPTTFAQATSTLSLGNKASISVGAPADGTTSGRRVTVAAITGGNVTATGTATHYALVDATNSRLLATHTLSESQVVTSGNLFDVAAFDITQPDPL